MVNKIDLLSDGEFIELVNDCSNISDVLKKLGYSTNGNSWGYQIVKERMEKLNLFFTKRNPIYYSQNNTALPLEKILIKDSEYNRTKLKTRLVKEGLKEYKCECCGITEWNGKPIALQLHHINGIHNDNRLSNLQLLCPNCHSQTENFGTKGKGMVIQRKCNTLPLEDKKIIMDTVSEKGIVEARKILPYRNSLINAVVRDNKDIYVMICLDGTELEFNTTYEVSKYLFEHFNIGTNPESCRSAVSKCVNGKQQSIKGIKFYKRSLKG